MFWNCVFSTCEESNVLAGPHHFQHTKVTAWRGRGCWTEKSNKWWGSGSSGESPGGKQHLQAATFMGWRQWWMWAPLTLLSGRANNEVRFHASLFSLHRKWFQQLNVLGQPWAQWLLPVCSWWIIILNHIIIVMCHQDTQIASLIRLNQVFKEWFYQFHTSSEFPWLRRDLNPSLLGPSPLFHPLHKTAYHY